MTGTGATCYFGFQQLVYSDLDHDVRLAVLYLPHTTNIVYVRYILYLTYISS